MNLEILWENNVAFYDLSTFMPNMINEIVEKSYLQEKNTYDILFIDKTK